MWFAKHGSRARVDLRGDERPDGTAIAFGWSDVDPAAAHAHALERARRLAAREGPGVRLYRTTAGYRALGTHRRYDPSPASPRQCWAASSPTPLHRRLCLVHRCFRARSSSKPSRLGLPPQTSDFPWDDDPDREARFRACDEAYRRASQRASVCKFVGTFGPEAIHPALAEVVARHDRWCLGAAPLA